MWLFDQLYGKYRISGVERKLIQSLTEIRAAYRSTIYQVLLLGTMICYSKAFTSEEIIGFHQKLYKKTEAITKIIM